MNYVIYRNKSNNKISKIEKAPNKYSSDELKILINNYNNEEQQDRIIELNDNKIIGEIFDYLDETEQLQNNWKTAIKKDLIKNIERAQNELNDLEMFVYNFKDEKND